MIILNYDVISSSEKGKPSERMGRKAIGPFERMAAELPKGSIFMRKNNLLLLSTVLLTLSFSLFQSPVDISAVEEVQAKKTMAADVSTINVKKVQQKNIITSIAGKSLIASTNNTSNNSSDESDNSIINKTTASSKEVIDCSSANEGIVRINYKENSNKKVKLIVEKSGKKYTYDLKANGSAESFPLQMGEGAYKIGIYENTSGIYYKLVKSDLIDAKFDDKNDVYLNSIQNIKWNDSLKAIAKAKSLTNNLKSDEEKINAIYNYVVSNVSYDTNKLSKISTSYVPSIENTYDTKKGICYDYSSLFAAMLRSINIPTKLIKGYAQNTNGYHAWNEVYINGKWVTIDTTYDSELKHHNYKVNMIKNSSLYKESYEY